MRILVTAGPTREPIDPVRFISNYSTGHMGYSIARMAKRRGHEVVLISGPPGELEPPQGIKVVYVETGREMFRMVSRYLPWCECLIMAAAVSDYRPQRYSLSKIKKDKKNISLKLLKNPDILMHASSVSKDKIMTGFCLDTGDLVKNAFEKLKSKKLDIIVANRIDKRNNPFGKGKTDVTIIDRNGKLNRIKGAAKEEISKILLDKIERYDILRIDKAS